MTSIKGFWAFTAIAVLLVPAASSAVSFDCSKAQTFREKAVCSNAELGKLDDLLNAAYKEATQTWGNRQALVDSQRQWMSDTKQCVDDACIAKAYRERIDELNSDDAEEGDDDNVEGGDTDNVESDGKDSATDSPIQAKPSGNSTNPLDGLIQQELEKTKRLNMESAKRTGDYSGIPAEDIEAEFGKKAAAPPPVPSPDSEGVVAGEIDIKGLRLGMPKEEFLTALGLPIDASMSSEGCFTGNIDMGDAASFVQGDAAIFCSGVFSYFGEKKHTVLFFFDQGKLRRITMRSFYGRTSRDDSLPPVVRALVEDKFKKNPVIRQVPEPSGHAVAFFTYNWTDPKGNTFSYQTQVEKDLSGYEFDDGTIFLSPRDQQEYVSKREILIRDAILQQKAREAQKQKSDL